MSSRTVKKEAVDPTIQKQREQHETNIAQTANSKDPLAAWVEYQKWTKATFPDSKTNQMFVLQSATKTFRHSPMYKQDIRYLRLWVLYADMLSNPIQLFEYLQQKQIGTSFALFYEAKALVLERSQQWQEVNATYELGIANKAKPVGRLEENYAKFIQRRKIHQKSVPPTSTDDSNGNVNTWQGEKLLQKRKTMEPVENSGITVLPDPIDASTLTTTASDVSMSPAKKTKLHHHINDENNENDARLQARQQQQLEQNARKQKEEEEKRVAEIQRMAKEQREKEEQQERERLQLLEHAKREQERLQHEAEQERIRIERLEAERVELERQKRILEEQEQQERLRIAELKRIEQERQQQERIRLEQQEREREMARLEAERLALEVERLRKEKEEREREQELERERERIRLEEVERKRLEQLRIEREQQERREQEQLERERLLREQEAKLREQEALLQRERENLLRQQEQQRIQREQEEQERLHQAELKRIALEQAQREQELLKQAELQRIELERQKQKEQEEQLARQREQELLLQKQQQQELLQKQQQEENERKMFEQLEMREHDHDEDHIMFMSDEDDDDDDDDHDISGLDDLDMSFGEDKTVVVGMDDTTSLLDAPTLTHCGSSMFNIMDSTCNINETIHTRNWINPATTKTMTFYGKQAHDDLIRDFDGPIDDDESDAALLDEVDQSGNISFVENDFTLSNLGNQTNTLHTDQMGFEVFRDNTSHTHTDLSMFSVERDEDGNDDHNDGDDELIEDKENLQAPQPVVALTKQQQLRALQPAAIPFTPAAGNEDNESVEDDDDSFIIFNDDDDEDDENDENQTPNVLRVSREEQMDHDDDDDDDAFFADNDTVHDPDLNNSDFEIFCDVSEKLTVPSSTTTTASSSKNIGNNAKPSFAVFQDENSVTPLSRPPMVHNDENNKSSGFMVFQDEHSASPSPQPFGARKSEKSGNFALRPVLDSSFSREADMFDIDEKDEEEKEFQSPYPLPSHSTSRVASSLHSPVSPGGFAVFQDEPSGKIVVTGKPFDEENSEDIFEITDDDDNEEPLHDEVEATGNSDAFMVFSSDDDIGNDDNDDKVEENDEENNQESDLIQETKLNPYTSAHSVLICELSAFKRFNEQAAKRKDIISKSKVAPNSSFLRHKPKRMKSTKFDDEDFVEFNQLFGDRGDPLRQYSLSLGPCIGEGGHARVFVVHHLIENTADDDDEDDNHVNLRALKYQFAQSTDIGLQWEFYIMKMIHQRLPQFLHPTVGKHNQLSPMRLATFYQYDNYMKYRCCTAFALREFNDASFLLMNYCDQGTLLDLVNAHRKKNTKFEEPLIAFYCLEILSILYGLHSCGIIHGDIKPDNFLLMNEQSPFADEWEDWKPSGAAGWEYRGLQLIDFGRSLDLHLYQQKYAQQFTGNVHVKEYQCIEMTNKLPWSYQIDLYGFCMIAHMLLHMEPLTVVEKKPSRNCRAENINTSANYWLPKQPFKRFWSFDWESLFIDMLNVRATENCLPILETNIRRLQEFLQQKPKVIRALLCKENTIMSDNGF